jgi:chromosome segregation ATPase
MLKHLQKFFAGSPAQPSASAEQQEEVVDMTTQTEATASAADTKIAELSASLATATDAIAANETKLSEVLAQLEAAHATLAAIESDKASLIAKAVEAKNLTRKEKVEATLGTDKAESVLAATASLDDAAFDAVLSAFSANFEAEANSPSFQEKGITADKEVDVKPSHFKQFINKAK